MQKLINLLALLSFGVSAGVVGAGAYVYLNKDSLLEQVKEQAIKSVTESLAGNLPVPAVPEVPGVPSAGPAGTSGMIVPGIPF